MDDPELCCTASKNKAGARRRQVIEAARKLFIAHGFHGTGIAQIARESGVAVGQLYRDFSAKEDIVAAIVAIDCRNVMAADALRLAILAGDEGQVRHWIHQFVTPEKDDDGRLFAEIIAEAARNARISEIFNTIHDDVSTLMLEALAMLAPGDHLADRRAALAEAILTMSLGLLHRQMTRPAGPHDRLVRSLCGIIDRDIDALRSDAAGANKIEQQDRA